MRRFRPSRSSFWREVARLVHRAGQRSLSARVGALLAIVRLDVADQEALVDAEQAHIGLSGLE